MPQWRQIKKSWWVETQVGCVSTLQPLICRRAGRRFALRSLDQLHVKAQRLQLANQHVKRFRHAGLHGSFALDDGLVNLGSAINVVGLRRQQLLQNERRTVRFQRPDFHFSEALSAELRLSTQRLLSDERVRPDGTRVNLVVHQVRQFQHVDVTNSDRLLELLARHSVAQDRLARGRQSGVFEQRLDLAFLRAIEYRRSHEHTLGERGSYGFELFIAHLGNRVSKLRVLEKGLQLAANRFRTRVLFQKFGDLVTQLITSPSEVGFENLAHVHTGRY